MIIKGHSVTKEKFKRAGRMVVYILAFISVALMFFLKIGWLVGGRVAFI